MVSEHQTSARCSSAFHRMPYSLGDFQKSQFHIFAASIVSLGMSFAGLHTIEEDRTDFLDMSRELAMCSDTSKMFHVNSAMRNL